MVLSSAKWEYPRGQELVGQPGRWGEFPILIIKMLWDTPKSNGSGVVTEPAKGAERSWEAVQAAAPESSGV